MSVPADGPASDCPAIGGGTEASAAVLCVAEMYMTGRGVP